jgi:hemolysin D
MVELARQGLAPRNSSLQLEQELVESEENIQVLRHRRSKIEASLESTKKQLNQADQEFNKQNIATLAEAQKQVTSLRQDLIKTKERVRLQKLRAPTDGYVQQLQISTVGGVVQPAQQLMFIVPQDEVLEVEAMVLNKDRGSIKVNQEAEVKLEAFNFTKHGTIGAVIRNISSDAVQDEKLGAVFPVRVSLLQNYIMVNDEKIRLTPGLNVTLEAKDSKRRVIEFILTPILKGFKEAAREK